MVGGLDKTLRVELVEFGDPHDTRRNGQHNTPQQTAGRPITYKKLNGEVARHVRHADVLARRVGRVGEDATRKLLQWNLSFSPRPSSDERSAGA